MRVAFTGGGTGGHILPNIAIIDELKKICGNACEFFYVGEKNSFEERMAVARGIPFYRIHAGKLRRYLSLKNVIDMFYVPFGLIEAVFALRRIKPDLIFAKGGYVSVPVVLAAHFLKIPVWLHESDVSAGLSNKICSRFAQKIWLSFEESKKFFAGKNVEVVGNPIRAEILKGNADRGYELTGFSKNKPVILIVGGSTGARALNKIVFEALSELLKKTQIVLITGALASHTETKKGYRR
ncbi:MAG: glycosyltransferase, partial [Patescibacteria group bacterium]